MKNILFFVLCVFVFAASGCRNVYDGMQAVQQHQCESLLPPDREDCLRKTQAGYDDYVKDRKEVSGRN